MKTLVQTTSNEAPAARLARGVCRMLADYGRASLMEFSLATGRRVDVIALAGDGTISIIEIKTTTADFRSDRKWPGYLDYCDRFYFAVPEAFPTDLLPEDHGLIVADAFGANILREAAEARLPPARRRALTLRFAIAAAARLAALNDPPPGSA